jgi:hypothetical protein
MQPLRILIMLVAAVATAQVASADAVLRLTQGASVVTITDGGAGDANGVAGAITYVGSLGSFSLNVTTGITKPIVGGVNAPEIDLNSVNVTSAGPGGTLTIEFTDTGFGLASGAGFNTMVGGTTGGFVSVASYYDVGNVEFDTSSPLSALGPFGTGSGTVAFSGVAGNPVGPLAGPYSLTLVATITHNGAATTSFDANLQHAPEPSTLVLLGAVAVAGFALRRRRSAA